MATIHHHHTSTTPTRRLARRHSLDYSLPSSTSFSSLFHHPTTTTLSLSATTTTTPITAPDSNTASNPLDTLERHLASGNFRQADEETRRLLIVLAGDAAVKRGYVFFSEVQFIPKEDLLAIDTLWRKFSNNNFGYSIQKNIWVKLNKDFTKFFIKVGWMKKLDTEVEQFNYRSFPSEFMWELNPPQVQETDNGNANGNEVSFEVPPEGHLPLTNALRGTQLLNCIFTHPAFADEGEEGEGDEDRESGGDEQVVVDDVDKKKSRLATLRDRLFKPNYSF